LDYKLSSLPLDTSMDATDVLAVEAAAVVVAALAGGVAS